MYSTTRCEIAITDAAQKIRARLQARRAYAEQDKLEINPAYSSQVFLYIERLLCERYLPGERVEENLCEIYLGSALTRLENLLPNRAGRLQKRLVFYLKKTILARWDELERKEALKMEADRIIEDFLSSSKSSESHGATIKGNSRRYESKESREMDDFARKFSELKAAAITLSRQKTRKVMEVEEEKLDFEIIGDDEIEELIEKTARWMARPVEFEAFF